MIHDKDHADWFLTAEDAKDIGLINHLRIPNIKIKIDVDMVVH